MDTKPTIQYDNDGNVVSEPDIERRVRNDVAQEVALLRGEKLPGLPCERGLIETLAQHSASHDNEEGSDCCAVSNAVKGVAAACGMEEIAGSDIDCCVRMSLAGDLLQLDKNLGGS